MNATRIFVEWMTSVPTLPDGGADYDHAQWAFRRFPWGAIKQARMFARVKAQRNPWRQVWIRTEHAPNERAPDWQWERDYSADEIVEAA